VKLFRYKFETSKAQINEKGEDILFILLITIFNCSGCASNEMER